MSEEEKRKQEELKKALSVIPPPSALRGERKQILEKRVKLRKRPDVNQGVVIVPEKTAKELGIKDKAEISVKGKRHVFEVVILDKMPEHEVWANPANMEVMGLEDNSAVTLRAAK
ncbi:MAG: hypothetical protein L7H12_02760 [Sulfolobales archaeon]|nr:hypothetical protein [Sulfolobales archaeon]MCG2884523.1 hypothetical protein [Sulfolobales archaeon]MCG2907849.1 hypothetical protein [Sulfolobales archaeon]